MQTLDDASGYITWTNLITHSLIRNIYIFTWWLSLALYQKFFQGVWKQNKEVYVFPDVSCAFVEEWMSYQALAYEACDRACTPLHML